MSAFWILVVVVVAVALLAVGAAALLARGGDDERKTLVGRIGRLSLRNKARLALALARDPRIPLGVRAIPPALVLYLAMPLDLIPDFIPVIGQLDDLLIVGLGIGLLIRFAPRESLAEHVERLERAQESG